MSRPGRMDLPYAPSGGIAPRSGALRDPSWVQADPVGVPDPSAAPFGAVPVDLELYSASQGVGSVLDAGTATADFTSDFRALVTRAKSWRVYGVQVVGTGANGGPFATSNWRAGGVDLGQAMVHRSAGMLPMLSPLPDDWAGELSCLITNRQGSASTIFATVWIAPWRR